MVEKMSYKPEQQSEEEAKLAELVSNIFIDQYAAETIYMDRSASNGHVGMSMPEIMGLASAELTKEKILASKDRIIDTIMKDGILDTSFNKTFNKEELEKLFESAVKRNDSIMLRFMNGSNSRRNKVNGVE